MATINVPASERRHLPERRVNASARTAALSALDWIAMVLMIIGGIGLGLIGAFEVDIFTSLFGVQTPALRLAEVVIGIASLYGIYVLVKMAEARR
jgi:uncharacterized protein